MTAYSRFPIANVYFCSDLSKRFDEKLFIVLLMNLLLYTPYSQYISRYFYHKVQKIPVDIGCSCPVRDGSISKGGCSFCNGRSFVPRFANDSEDLLLQIEDGISFYKRKTKGKIVDYLVYFQAGTNTYMSLTKAKRLVETALSKDEVRGLVFSTRPDCLSDEWLAYLKELSKETFVEVELGMESVNDEVLKSMGRGHDFACSVSSISRLHEAGIPVCAHLILGLPGESRKSMIDQATWMSRMKVEVIKLHQLQILKGSRLARSFEQHPECFSLFLLHDYVELVADFLEHLSPQVAVERFVSQSPSTELIAPKWGVKNDVVTNLIKSTLLERGTFQGAALLTNHEQLIL